MITHSLGFEEKWCEQKTCLSLMYIFILVPGSYLVYFVLKKFLIIFFKFLLDSVESPKEGKGSKSSPLSVKNAKRKMEGPKKAKGDSPVNGLLKGQESRSQSRSREQSYSRSPSRSASPKRRKSDSGSTSGGSKSQSRSRSRSDSPPRQVHRGAPYKGSEVRGSRKSKDCKHLTQKPHKSRSRSSSRSRSRSRERTDSSGKYKKKSHYYRDQRRERSRSYERTGHRYERDHPGHSRHRR